MSTVRTAGKYEVNDLDKGMAMHDDLMTVRKIGFRERRKNICLFLAVLLMIVFALGMSPNVLAAKGKVTAHGMLTSIEPDGSVIIDAKGYLVSPYVVVQDFRGVMVPLSSFLPSRFVEFEYESTTRGFVIILIKEIAQ